MTWVTILKTKSSIEAELLVNTLESQGIGAIVLNKQVAGYPWIGFIEVKVLEELKTEAENILAGIL